MMLTTAARQRESARRFRSLAALHTQHAERLARSRSRGDGADSAGSFIATLADQLRQPSAALTVLGSRREVLATAASDATSRVAQSLELTTGEGPAHDVAADRPSAIGTATLVTDDVVSRWPYYGPSIASLGVHAVVAAALGPVGYRFGALIVFCPTPAVATGTIDRLADLAASLTHGEQEQADAGEIVASSDGLALLLDEVEIHAVVHQATGMLSAQLGLPIGDALAVLRARAFADGQDINSLAEMVVRRDVHFS